MAQYGSDVMVEVLQGLGIEYVAMNPGRPSAASMSRWSTPATRN